MRGHHRPEDSGDPSGQEERRNLGEGRKPGTHHERRQWRLFAAGGDGWSDLASAGWRPASALRSAVLEGAPWDVLGPQLTDSVLEGGGPLSRMLRKGLVRRTVDAKTMGVSDQDVWPMPLLSLRLPPRGRGRLRARRRLAAVHVAN